jgi:uncharacterized phage infection (PIP) family protein YhgE
MQFDHLRLARNSGLTTRAEGPIGTVRNVCEGDNVATAKKSQTNTPTETSFADGDLGKLQGILFGEQSRSIDERLSALEKTITDMIARTNSELGSRLSSTESDLRHQLAVLSDRVDKNSNGAGEAALALRKALDGEAARLDTSVADVRAALATTKAEQQAELSKLSNTAAKDLAKSTAALTAQINDLAEALQQDKVGRNHLADLLVQAADGVRTEPGPAKRRRSGSAAD